MVAFIQNMEGNLSAGKTDVVRFRTLASGSH